MPKIIEVTVSPQGETTVETKGYAGGECLEAGRWLERALGSISSLVKTAEFFSAAQEQQKEIVRQ